MAVEQRKPAAPWWSRDPRFDLPALAIGVLTSSALAVGVALLLLMLSRSTESSGIGPTAASLDDGFATLVGAGIGLFAGAVATAAITRSGSRMTNTILGGAIAYCVLVPIMVVLVHRATSDR